MGKVGHRSARSPVAAVADDELLAALRALKYTDLRRLPTGELAGLQRFLFTTGLVVGLDAVGYRVRYCYGTAAEARAALRGWDGAGDPSGGWMKAKGAGVDRVNPRFKGIEVAMDAPAASAPGRRAARKRGRIVRSRAACADHRVLTVEGGSGLYRRKPCTDCPWRVDATGVFPAEAFRHSAGTAYDMAQHTFACHQSGSLKPAICAGFLLRGADHNLSVRLRRMSGAIADDVSDGGCDLHADYRAMAIANGVEPDDPVLAPCR